MPIVVVQQDGAYEPLLEWVVADEHTRDAEEREVAAWDVLCRKLVERAATSAVCPLVNVFLVYDEEEFEDRDRPALARLLTHARNRSWGARLFLVLSNAPPVGNIEPLSRPDLTAWMNELISGRITDLIQIRRSDLSDREALQRTLRDSASAVVERHKLFLESPGQRLWRCALPANWVDLADVLGEFAITEPDDDSWSDLVIVLEPAEAPEEYEAEIDRYLIDQTGNRRRCRVVTHMHWPSRHLKQYCAAKGLGQPIVTAGDFELWYLLLGLNVRAVIEQVTDMDSVESVPLAKSPLLRPCMSARFPTLLVTSVFDPQDEEQWLEAAKDVGEFLLLFPVGMDYRVELAIDPERLNAILAAMPLVDAWIHMGHGHREKGLWVPANGGIPPERWTQCFHDRELCLALFLTCNSDEIARHFAEQGAGVAIGFDGIIESSEARQLALGVLKVMLVEGTGGRSILAGFHSGEARFEAVHVGDARPKAYHPRRI